MSHAPPRRAAVERASISRFRDRLRRIYPGRPVEGIADRLEASVARARAALGDRAVGDRWSERDLVLITYGDSLRETGRPPLAVLEGFLRRELADAVGCVHVLPFFPWSSDDGFSVTDFRSVSPDLGSWEDVERLAGSFDLMVDLVVNHASRQGEWFAEWAAGRPERAGWFRTEDPGADLSAVVRPRTSPLLVPADTVRGREWLWATFGPDQVDLDYRTPEVLAEMVDVLADMLGHGARFVRLDAIAFLWKELGTPCIHHPRTHEIVRLFREVLDAVRPEGVLITETNVPHRENLSYLGSREANLVYQFALPPLVLHALDQGRAGVLTEWAASLPEDLPPDCSFLNFTASHDGIGLRPLEGLLSEEEVDRLVRRSRRRGALVGPRTGPDGRERPYELNVTLFDALDRRAEADPRRSIDRFLVSQAIPLALRGVPAVYVQSLFAGRNDTEAVRRRGIARAINRRPYDLPALERRLADPGDEAAIVFRGLRRLMEVRRRHAVFHPRSGQTVLDLGSGLFGVRRTDPVSGAVLVALHDVAGRGRRVRLGARDVGGARLGGRWRDLWTGAVLDGIATIAIEPYGIRWLQAESS